jgi:branched-chain amino acid transport system permease protein
LGIVAAGVGVFAILATLPLGLSSYQTVTMTTAFYYAILGLSWNLLAGFTGQFSVAQAALATASAYSSAAAVLWLGLPTPVGIVVGGAVGGLLGFGLGSLTLRMRGIYFALATWAFAETVRLLLAQNYTVTGGDNGLPVPSLFPTLDPVPYYYLFFVALAATLLFCALLIRSKVGFRMRSIRDDEEIAVALGINAFRWKRYVFTISAALAGLAGALYGHTVGLLSPSLADFSQMTIVIVGVVLGGYRTLWGPIIGIMLAQGLAEVLRFSNELRLVVFATIVIAIVRFYPPGLLGGLAALRRRVLALAARRRPPAEAAHTDKAETS